MSTATGASESSQNEYQLELAVKPFGKDGVRLCWSWKGGCAPDEGDKRTLIAESQIDGTWFLAAQEAGQNDAAGVIVLRTLSNGLNARGALFRIQDGIRFSNPSGLIRTPGLHRAIGNARSSSTKYLGHDDAGIELVYNILQWYSTVVIDTREATASTHRFLESLVCPDLASMVAIPLRDDAIVIGDIGQDCMNILRGRVARCTYIVPPEMATGVQAKFPFLCGNPHEKRFALPNIIADSLVVGHQGHALTLEKWSACLGITGVINLAPDKVASAWDAIPFRHHYVEVRHADGNPLFDVAGEGGRLRDILPGILRTIADSVKECPEGRIFIHCQQGRSRSCSVAVAQLLATHDQWTLLDALAFLAERRPEAELNMSYLEALEDLAVEMGKNPSLERLLDELPRHVRTGGVARDFS